jgi:hypothetical protein
MRVGAEGIRAKLAIFGLTVALVFTLVGLGIADAVIPSADGTFTICRKTRNGNARVIDAVEGCRANESRLSMRSYEPIGARIGAEGAIVPGTARHVTAAFSNQNLYTVRFDRDVRNCLVAIALRVGDGEGAVWTPGTNANEILVATFRVDPLVGTTSTFDITVTC